MTKLCSEDVRYDDAHQKRRTLKGPFSKTVLISVPSGNRLEWC
jgi:hypothetical protein